MSIIKQHPVLAYYALVFAISWGGMLLVVGPGEMLSSRANPAILNQFIYFAALAGPSLAGLLMTWLMGGTAGLRALFARLLHWRVGLRWYLVALLTAPLLMALILFALSLTFTGYVSALVASHDRVGLVQTGVVLGLVVSFFEELGWMGFAAPELRTRHGILATGIIMGLIWGAWHFPLFSGYASASGAIPPCAYLAVMLFSFLVPYRILMVWLFERSRSLFVVMLSHAPLAGGMLILLPEALSGPRLVSFDLAFGAALWVLVAAVCVASGRHGRGKLAPPPPSPLANPSALC